MAKCQPGTIPIPGGGCAPLDGPDGCGPPPWGSIAELPEDVYVDPSFTGPDRNGSRERPLASIAEATQRVAPSGRIVLAEGEYDEPVEVTKSIQLVGRCASLVTVRGELMSDSGELSTIWIHGVETFGMSGVHVRTRAIGVLVEEGQASLRHVHITGEGGTGVAATREGASVDMSRALIEREAPKLGAGAVWTSMLVFGGARARIEESALLGGDINLRVSSEGQEVTVKASLIEASPEQETAGDTYGALVDAGKLKVEDIAIANNHVGILTTGDAAELAAVASVFASPEQGGTQAAGVIAEDGARVTLDSSAFIGPCDAQLAIRGRSTVVAVTGNLFQGTDADREDRRGRGVELSDGELTLTASAILSAHDTGLLATGGILAATGNVIVGSAASQLDPSRAAALRIEGTRATLRSTYIASARLFGVFIGESSSVTLDESLIEGTQPGDDGDAGIGLYAGKAETVAVRASAILKSQAAGLLIASSPAAISGVLIQDVESGALATGSAGAMSTTVQGMGDGLLTLGATANVTSARVARCARAGLLFDDSDGTIDRSSSIGNRFGLVLQGARGPALGDGNLFEDNAEGDTVTGGELPVPADEPSGR